jgi:LysR family transcriptional regulator, transcriptional activator of nhaA
VLNFNHLYYFHVTASEGSIKAAADRLKVTQPTVSEQLRMLERALGVELFERTPTGLKLTLAGREASEHAAAMFLAGERLVRALGEVVDPPEIVLRVGASAAMARTIAAEFLMPVLTLPDCRPSIRAGDFIEMLRDLRSRELDLVIGETEPAELARAGLTVELICRPDLVAIVPIDVEPREDWKNLSLLQYRTTSAYRWEVETYLHAHGLRPNMTGELDDAFLMLEAVQRGGFAAFVSTSIARSAISQQRVKVLATISPETAGIYAVYPEGDTLQLARTAVALLLQNATSSANSSL